MSYNNFSDNLVYDNCAVIQQNRKYEDVRNYQFFLPGHENCGKCVNGNKFYFKQDASLVDMESELKNQTRPASLCSRFKYSSNCKKTNICTSTFDKDMPQVTQPLLCKVVGNNMPKFVVQKFPDPVYDFCKK